MGLSIYGIGMMLLCIHTSLLSYVMYVMSTEGYTLGIPLHVSYAIFNVIYTHIAIVYGCSTMTLVVNSINSQGKWMEVMYLIQLLKIVILAHSITKIHCFGRATTNCP